MYLGNQPALAYTSFAKQDFTTSATTSYTLDNPVANENEIALFINFVRQEPTTAYTANGVNLTLTSATSASDDMYCVYLGKAVQTVNPPAGSVGTNQLADTSVTPAKLNLNDNLLFNTADKGIYLGVTTATVSNLLDDYEEGDWTPTINSGTMTINQAHYTKIGNRCFIDFALSNFSDTTSATDIIITGLPFAQVSGRVSVGSAYGERTDVSKPQIELSSGSMRFRAGFGVSNFDTALQYSDINQGADLAINGSIVYRTN